MLKTYVINLKRSQDRKKDFDKLNSKYIDYEYYEAIDGKELKEVSHSIVAPGSIFTKPFVGSAMSHLELWKKCIEMKEPIIIMEDDAFVSCDFKKHLNDILDKLPKEWDFLSLTFNSDSLLQYSYTNYDKACCIFEGKKFGLNEIIKFQNEKIHPTVCKLHMLFGIGCYVITPKCAKKLIQECFPMENTRLFIPMKGYVKSYSLDIIMNNVYPHINAFVCPVPFVMTKHLCENYTSLNN